MSAPDTLADLVLRETYRPRSPLASGEMRRALTTARRFVMDEGMSAFMADIAQVPFHVPPVRRPEVLDTLRHGARLPHSATWIEFDGRAFRAELLKIMDGATTDVFGASLGDHSTVVPRWGWLMQEHPQMPQAVQMHQFMGMGGRALKMPMRFVWQTTDEPLPWAADTAAGEIAHGITGYQPAQMGVIYAGPIPKERQLRVGHEGGGFPIYTTDKLLAEVGGTIRYAVALLATLNDVPVELTDVRQSHGFVARGAYRKYLDHTTVRLRIPVRQDTRRLAKKLVALARRRAHQVRGHWRLYERGEGTLCPDHAHAWGPADLHGRAQCTKCPAWRKWIDEHQRGDAGLGFVTHDYAVTHTILE